MWIDCEQSLFGQSRLSSAGLERANSRERGKRECEASESRGEAGEKAGKEGGSLFFPPLSSSPLGQFALSSPAELRRDWPKRDCSQSNVWTEALSGMVSAPAQKLSALIWTQPKRSDSVPPNHPIMEYSTTPTWCHAKSFKWPIIAALSKFFFQRSKRSFRSC